MTGPALLTEQGLKDGVAALGQIRAILKCRLCDAETRLSAADQDVTELRKLDSFARLAADEYRARLTAIEAAGP